MTTRKNDDPSIPQEMAQNNGAFLRFEDLCKIYDEGGRPRKVLQNASLDSSKGEFLAILGKSGSGKTTFLNLVSGIDRVDCGEVFLGGLRLTGLNETERTLFRRRNIGFIFQFFNLLPTLTVWENILLPLELNDDLSAANKQRAIDLLREVGLAGREASFPDRLSGGEQQRVAIVRALVHDPLLILADEPTGNLDEETGRSILGLLDRLTRRAGKNLILVTHSLEAANYADRVFSLKDGHLVQLEKAV